MSAHYHPSTHSPSPFTVEVSGPATRFVVKDANGQMVAITYGAPEQEKDARLIAAAPDLLAALRGLMRAIVNDEPVTYDLRGAALAAITKAEG